MTALLTDYDDYYEDDHGRLAIHRDPLESGFAIGLRWPDTVDGRRRRQESLRPACRFPVERLGVIVRGIVDYR